MTTRRRRSDAANFTDKQTITVGGTWANNDTATITINTKDIIVTFGAGAPTVAQVTAALAAAWNGDAVTAYGETRNTTGDLIPEANLMTASSTSTTVVLLNDTTGVPFTVTTSKSSASGTVSAPAATVAPSGPKFWTDADNWTPNAIPVSTDDIYLENHDGDILYSLGQSAVTLTSLNILASWTGKLGLPDQSETADYYEYLATYLAISATTLNVGDGPGDGSSRLKIDVGSNVCTLNLYKTGTSVDRGIPTFLWKGTHASNVVNVRRGDLGIAWLPGETSTVATLRVGYIDNQAGDATVRCGTGLTLTTLEQTGGTVLLQAGLTTITKSGGDLTLTAGNVTTVTNREGVMRYNGNGTLTTVNLHDGATLDLTQGQGTCTITTLNLYAGATFLSPKGRFGSAPTIRLNGCTIDEVTIVCGDDFNIVHV